MRFRKHLKQPLMYLLAVLISVIVAIPFLWMLQCSLQPDTASIFHTPVKLLPKTFRLQNYFDAFQKIKMGRLLKNTMILVVSNMALSITSSVMIAYGFARFRARLKNVLFYLLLGTMMLPWVVTMVPAYIIFYKIGWVGTFLPLIAPSIGGNAFYIFMLRQYLMGIPRDFDEAATLDGCSRLGILIRILLPQCKPILATLVIFSFTGTWSDYVGPSIYLQKPSMQTLSIGLEYFRSMTSVMPWNLVMAACVMFSIPMILVMFFAQNAFTRGIVTSGLK